jgi:SAM-dependent methyltransferase
MSTWDPRRTAEYYDAFGEKEWTRFEEGVTPPAGLDIHVRFLERFVRSGDRVLDAGAGPGRFSLELVRLGAEVVALDISPGQLEQLRARLPEIETHLGDVTDLSAFANGSFDVTVCYGGPLSYVLDRAEDTLAELVRVTRSGGHVLLSVMSTIGTVVHYLSVLFDLARRDGVERQVEIVRTGFLPEAPDYGHLALKMYRWSELEAMLSRHGDVVAAAAAGLLPDLRPEEPELQALVQQVEAELCEEPGAVSSGQHIVAALRVSENR